MLPRASRRKDEAGHTRLFHSRGRSRRHTGGTEVDMRRVAVFNHVSLDGFFTDMRGDMSFAHNTRQDPEWDAFVEHNTSGSGTLVFGRVTYEMMAGFWP